MAWIGVKVTDREGNPQPNVEVRLYRSDPVSWKLGTYLIATETTDEDGECGFGVWDVWYTYVVYGVRAEDDFQTTIAFVTVGPFEEKDVELVGSEPPHYYLMKVTVNYVPAGLVEWLIEQLREGLEEIYPIEILDVWVEGNTVYVSFVIRSPVDATVVIITVLLLLLALGIVAWEISKQWAPVTREVVEKVPTWVWGLLALGIAGFGVAAFASAVR